MHKRAHNGSFDMIVWLFWQMWTLLEVLSILLFRNNSPWLVKSATNFLNTDFFTARSYWMTSRRLVIKFDCNAHSTCISWVHANPTTTRASWGQVTPNPMEDAFYNRLRWLGIDIHGPNREVSRLCRSSWVAVQLKITHAQLNNIADDLINVKYRHRRTLPT